MVVWNSLLILATTEASFYGGWQTLTHWILGIRLRRINLLHANDLRHLLPGKGASPSDQKRDR